MPRAEEPATDEVVNPLLVHAQGSSGSCLGGNDCVMVSHLPVINEATAQRPHAGARSQQSPIWRLDGADHAGQGLGRCRREMPTGSPRVADELVTLIESLCNLER